MLVRSTRGFRIPSCRLDAPSTHATPRRRDVLFASSWSIVNRLNLNAWSQEQDPKFRLYTDPQSRFSLSVSTDWTPTEKPGAEILFKGSASTSLGITVAPVKVTTLDAFGTTKEIVEKLLDAERRKDGFLDVKLLETVQQTAKMGVPFDVFEYDLQTVRGNKRIVTGDIMQHDRARLHSLGVTIDGYRLFIVNGSCKAPCEDTQDLISAVQSFRLL